jgi:hypothetical protein
MTSKVLTAPKSQTTGMRRIVVRKTGAIRPTAACGCYHPTRV